MLRFECKKFNELTINELYAILALRQEVFVVEQNCVFQDIDFKDQMAIHCMGYDAKNQLMTYTRLFDQDQYYEGYCSIGRVVASPLGRGKGYGKIMFQHAIDQCLNFFGPKNIQIGAQAYLEKFYNSFGFASIHQDYIEDGIPHLLMVKKYELTFA